MFDTKFKGLNDDLEIFPRKLKIVSSFQTFIGEGKEQLVNAFELFYHKISLRLHTEFTVEGQV